MDPLHYGYFAVAFLDVLGQQDEWKGMAGLPRNPGEHEALLGNLRRTVGYVDSLRSDIRNTMAGFTKGSSLDARLPEKERGEFRRLRNADARIHVFSDTLVVSTSLAETETVPCPINGLYNSIAASTIVMLTAMAQGHVLRGSIEVSTGIRMPESGEVYGPALNEAYRLESKEADYPRIVIGRGMLEYLNAMRHGDTTPAQKATAVIAQNCLKFLTRDLDGKTILDYLNPAPFKMMDSLPGPDIADLIRLVGQHITQETEKWRKAGNSLHIGRYDRLRGYFNSRVEPAVRI